MGRIGLLVWKELIELRQDPRLFGVIVVAPILQLLLLGYAATTDVRNVPLVIVDADHSVESRELISRFSASSTFTIVALENGIDDVDPYLERGEAWLAVMIPSDYGAAIRQGRAQTVQLVADGSDGNSAGVALSYASGLITGYGQEVAAKEAAQGTAGTSNPGALEPRIRVWFNPTLESRDFMIPGIVALLLLLITTNLSSMGIVREKEIGTLEQL